MLFKEHGCTIKRFLTSYTNDIFYKILYNMILRFSKNTAVLLRDSSLRIGMTPPPIPQSACHSDRREESAGIPNLALGKWQILVIQGFTIDVISIRSEESLNSTAVFFKKRNIMSYSIL